MREFSEIAAEAERTVDAEIAGGNDTQKQVGDTSTQPEQLSQEQEAQVQADLDKDEGFKKTVPQNFREHKDWRKLYWKKSDAERKAQKLQEQLDALSQQEPEELDDNQLTELAEQRGFVLTKAEKQQVVQNIQQTPTQAGKIAKLQQMIDLAQTPEERKWWSEFSDALLEEGNNRIATQFDQRYGEVLKPYARGGEFHEEMVQLRLDRQENLAKRLIEKTNKDEGLDLSFERDIEPELAKMIKAANGRINKYNANIFDLTEKILARKGISLGKQLAEKKFRELNEQKKKANVETETVTTPQGQPVFKGKSWGDRFKLAEKVVDGQY